MFEIELVICIKMDLALNNLQRLICHKTQPTNQPIKSIWPPSKFSISHPKCVIFNGTRSTPYFFHHLLYKIHIFFRKFDLRITRYSSDNWFEGVFLHLHQVKDKLRPAITASFSITWSHLERSLLPWDLYSRKNNNPKHTSRPGFNPRSRHTKDFKNGTWYLLA